MAKHSVLVLNMATGEEQTYMDIEPISALISAAILGENKLGDVSNPLTRARMRKLVLYGKKTASIGDYGVEL
jgi:hypothetical protein